MSRATHSLLSTPHPQEVAFILMLISLDRYVVDAADHKNVDISREELHELIGKPSLKVACLNCDTLPFWKNNNCFVL